MAKIEKIKLPNDETIYELEGTVTDISNTTSSIDTIQTEYPDIDESDKASTLFGKIKKFLSDLKSKVNSLNSDLANKQDAATAITTSNIGSQSVNYANSAGSAPPTAGSNNYMRVYNTAYIGSSDRVTFNDLAKQNFAAGMIYPATDNPRGNASWVHTISMNWSDGSNTNWVSQLGIYVNADPHLYFRSNGGNTIVGKDWKTVLDNSNYSSYALPISGGTMKGVINYPNNQWFNWTNSNGRILAGESIKHMLYASSEHLFRNYANSAYVYCYAAGFSVQSSKLIKTNIKDMSDNEANKIMNLRVVEFDYINKDDGTNQQGLIAEEVRNIYPHCVTVPPDYNEDEVKKQIASGNNSPRTLGIDYSKLVAPLIKMVQIQQRQIDELKAEVEELRKEVNKNGSKS